MTTRIAIIGTTIALALGGCSGAGSGTGMPSQFVGNWGADCTAPFVGLGSTKIHDFPNNADYPLETATFSGGELKVTYKSATGSVTDTYASAGSTLTLVKTATGGSEVTLHKAPMSKCK